MPKIFNLLGKSSSGKDTIYKKLIEESELKLKQVVTYTTRPIREGELEGREYHFVTEEKLRQMQQDGIVVEKRTYDTVHGPWTYFTADDGQIDLSTGNYLVIGTLESYEKIRQYYGAENVVPLYIWIDDITRLERALLREKSQKEPKIAELCRRYLADEADFAPDKLAHAGVSKRYENYELSECLAEIKQAIRSQC